MYMIHFQIAHYGKGCTEEVGSNKGKERKEASRITEQLKRALDFSNALVYNLLRKRIGCVIRLPSVATMK